MPWNYFIFNLAPIMETKAVWFQDYIKCLSRHNLIDYSFNNISSIGNLNAGSVPAHFFDFGFFDLMPFRGIERSDNYIFYGKLNEDRMKRLKSFQSAGLKLNIMQNIWGHERDIQIRKAKAVVNIGKYDPNILEVYRIWHSLCLGTPIYSDAGIDEVLAKKYSKYINLSNRLEVDSFLTPPESANLYQDETSFIESTKSLLTFLKQ